ncbi:MAG: efflux RND transporter periplasmic adaptor subunit [Acetobacteraceae bacterium]|nr:efflux RND transporter periplasmic adaptor subunit [Acetobacteraceae bacterium]
MSRAGVPVAAAVIVLATLSRPVQAQAPGQGGAAPPPAVLVAPIRVENVAPVYSFIGRVVAIQSVQVVARVTAFIEKEPAKQGSDVKAGETLFELQKTQYQAAVQAAQAQLDGANAAVRNAQLAYDRSSRLAKQGFEAQANFDQATATLQQNQSNVLAAQANLTQAALNLSYCTIVSPIDGRIGAVTLTVGNLVTPSTPPLLTVNELDPIRVVYSVSDRTLVAARQRTGASTEQLAADLVVEIVLPDGSKYAHTGKISFLSNEVDPQTGTVSVYADFPNPERLLLPGSFVTTNVRRAQPEEAPLVPVAAVQTEQSGRFVLLVDPNNTVRQQPIELGRQVGQDYIATKGLRGGERVIVEGVQKVHPGQKVNPQPLPQATPVAAAGTGQGGG